MSSDTDTFELPDTNGKSPIQPIAPAPVPPAPEAKEAPVAPPDTAKVQDAPAASPKKKRRRATPAQLQALERGRKVYQEKRRKIREEKALEKAEKIRARNMAKKQREAEEHERIEEDLDSYKTFLAHMGRYEKYKISKYQNESAGRRRPAPTPPAPKPTPAVVSAPTAVTNPYSSFFA